MRTNAVFVALLLGSAAVLHGQQVRGRTIDAGSRSAVPAVELRIHDADNQKPVATTSSNENGVFVLVLPAAGRYVVHARRLGYLEAKSELLAVRADELIEIEIALSVLPLPVAPLRVTADSEQRNPYLKASGFYARRESGVGYFLTWADIELHGGVQLSDVLRRVPGVRLLRPDGRRADAVLTRANTGRRCMPAIFLDGIVSRAGGAPRITDVVIDDMVPATEIEGIEIYHGPSQAPAVFSRHAECGAIVVWTKRRI